MCDDSDRWCPRPTETAMGKTLLRARCAANLSIRARAMVCVNMLNETKRPLGSSFFRKGKIGAKCQRITQNIEFTPWILSEQKLFYNSYH
jgi:hypothetical protein